MILKMRAGAMSLKQGRFVLTMLRRGGVVVYPTDTAYGLAVDPRVRGAVKKIFTIKGRDEKNPLSFTVASTAMAKKYGIFSPLAKRLAAKHWPGALTLVVPLRKIAAARPLRSLRGGNSVGLRYPDHPIAVALAKKLGYPITSTSANRSGAPACYTLEEFVKQFGIQPSLRGAKATKQSLGMLGIATPSDSGRRARNDSKMLPDLFLDAGALPKRPTSTVVDCTRKIPVILRQGSVVIGH